MISFYETQAEDIDKMTFNKYSEHLKNAKDIRNIKKFLTRDDACAFTVYDDEKDKPVAVLLFFEFEIGMVQGMIIADECFGDNPKYALKMRWLIKHIIQDFRLVFVITVSEDCIELNRWHYFLGFKELKKLPKYRNNKDYILWKI